MSFESETVIPSNVFSFEGNFQIAFIFSVRDVFGTVLYFSSIIKKTYRFKEQPNISSFYNFV